MNKSNSPTNHEDEVRRQIEQIIAKGLGWVKFDDTDISPFAGMWVEDGGKAGHDLSKAKFLDELVAMQHTAVTEARIETVLKVLDSAKIHSADRDFTDFINSLATYRAQLNSKGKK